MKRFIIDNENISIDSFLNIKKISPDDKIYIVANTKQKLSFTALDELCFKKIKIKTILLDGVGKDFADKIIVFLMGRLFNKKGKIYVVSNDKFYDKAIDFLNKKSKRVKFKRIGIKRQENPSLGSLNLIKDMSVIINQSANLNELHLSLVAKFGSKDGLVIYNNIKQKAREIYAKNVELIPVQKSNLAVKDANLNVFTQDVKGLGVCQDRLDRAKELMASRDNLQNLHFLLKEEFGAQEGALLYKNIKDKAREIYSKKTKENPQNGEHKSTKKRQEVEMMVKSSKNLSEFHNALVKKYGQEGANIYKKLKDKIRAYYEKRAKI